ncbi:MAG: 3'-5' exonuclease domain-containing protein 2 [Proteobacteria bacterium]|nr:3'-5' exonuclease domain-containing protein 2 [Pseudomonadota bacterium]MBU1687690.1 3'-5' exonuclease domain-containing protein 2 [Pseudomonadota bacterium]
MHGYGGKINLVRTPAELDEALAILNRQELLGFDTETQPNFKKGQNHPTALIQLAGKSAVFIFQLKTLGFPPELKELLANPAIIKAGVAVDQDLIQLKALGSFTDGGFIELATVARHAGIKNHGLRGLTAVLLGFRISKGAQRSNWGNDQLTSHQIHYAATDAWAGREIYLRLKEMSVIYSDIFLDD